MSVRLRYNEAKARQAAPEEIALVEMGSSLKRRLRFAPDQLVESAAR